MPKLDIGNPEHTDPTALILILKTLIFVDDLSPLKNRRNLPQKLISKKNIKNMCIKTYKTAV